MNNIFKVIWNHATQTWTAVGELASAKGKSKSVKLAAISTALLMAASSVEAAKVISTAGELGQLSIATDKVTNQFFGNDRYKAETGLSKNVAGATVNAYDGIAIGNGAVSGSPSGTGGNGHVAIGLMAQASAGGANGQNAAVALGAYSLATGQGGTAIGAHSIADALNSTALGKVARANGDGSTAVGTSTRAEWQGTALGNTAQALANYATSIGVNSKANSHSSISIGKQAVVSGQNAIGVGTQTQVNGVGTVAVGSGTKVSSANVSTLGSNINVGSGRDGAVVLGHGSDAGKETTKVMAVNSAVADGSPLVYSGFAGKLNGSDTNGTNKEAKGKQGNLVSVGSEGNERQIKHVAAGQITDKSTDAINGSQLYQVAKTLGKAADQTAKALGVTLNKDGTLSKFSQPLTIAKGSNYTGPAAAGDVKTALNNLNEYVNAGWNVTASGNDYKNNVSVGHTVNFVGSGNVDVKGSNVGYVRTVNISVDSPVDYTTTTANVGGNNVNVVKANDGKWYKEGDVENGMPKNGIDPIPANTPIVKQGATLKDSNNKPYKKGNTYTYDDKGNITATAYDATKPESKDTITAGNGGVQLNNVGWATKPDQAVNKDQLDQTVNKSGFYVQQNGKTTVINAKNKRETEPTKSEKVTPNDVINFVNGHGTRMRAITKRNDKGVDVTTVYVDIDKGTEPNSLPAVYTDENGNKLRPDGNNYYPADAVKINGKWYPAGTTKDNVGKTQPLEPVSNVIISMNNPNSDGNTAGDPVAVTNVGKGTKNYDDQTAGEKSPEYKDAINGLANLEGSKDSNVLTVADAKNFGWVVSTSDNKQATAVKNADVVDFKAEEGTGITVEGKLDDTNTKMTVTVGNKHFKTNTKNTVPAAKATGENSVAIGGNSNAAVENAIAIGNGAEVAPTAAQGSVAIGAGAKAGKANVGSYSIDPSATVAGKTGPDTRVVSVGDKGNEAQIQNVAPGVISETSTDAVNGSQLHATNTQVNKNTQAINKVINNQAGAFDRLERKINKQGKEARAGIAGANAAAALPQAYTAGKAMVAAAAGTFKGQNALAVGYSRISDNGKVILKLQGNANTSGDVGAGVGVGYQW